MEISKGYSRLGSLAVLLACILAPAWAAAQVTVPVIVRVTEVWQLGDVDGPPGSLGDFYPEVLINGVRHTNSAYFCDNPPPQGYIVPYQMFTPGGSDPSCHNTPWTFAVDLPLHLFQRDPNTPEVPKTVPIRIEVWDEDLVSDNIEASINLQIPLDGRWTGGKNWPENCNRPVECCSGVRFCWEIEVGPDSDGDGLFDAWEQNGIDTDGDGNIDLNLPDMGANWRHKDIFVELDWRPGFQPRRAEVLKWKEAFAAAPVNAGGVPNPDGLPGINLRVDTGALTEGGQLVGDNLGGGNQLAPQFSVCSLRSSDPRDFYAAKAQNFNDPVRGLAFHYAITSTRCCTFGARFGVPCTTDADCAPAVCQDAGGEAELGGDDLVVWRDTTGLFQGSGLMHELGHNLNLHHGGARDDFDNCKPNYLSIMNYDHFEIQRRDGSSILDFSPPRQSNGARGRAPLILPEGHLVEASLDETRIVDPTDPECFLAHTYDSNNDGLSEKVLSLVGSRIDWNGDGNTTGVAVAGNVDDSDGTTGFPARCRNSLIQTAAQPLLGHDDWTNISLPFLHFGDAADGPVNPTDEREPTDREILRARQSLNSTDLRVTQSGNAGPVEAGATVDLSYVLTIENQGPNPALPPRGGDTIPSGASVLSHAPECVEGPAGELTCNLTPLLAGETKSLPLSVRKTASCSGGLPQPIVNVARVQNAAEHAGADPDPADNTSSFTTAVVDTTAPAGGITGPPDGTCFGPGGLPVVVTDNYTDVCDPTLTRTYVPAGGPSYSDQGDHHVVLTAKDDTGNASTDTVDFTIDIVPPVVTIKQPAHDQLANPPLTNLINIVFTATDNDGASGGIDREVIKLQGCVIYDGDTLGDRDGLLSDEGIQLNKSKLCQFMARCGFTILYYPKIRVESTDACGANTGFAERIIRKQLLKQEVCR